METTDPPTLIGGVPEDVVLAYLQRIEAKLARLIATLDAFLSNPSAYKRD